MKVFMFVAAMLLSAAEALQLANRIDDVAEFENVLA